MLTSFYDRTTGGAGPVIGALHVVTIDFDAIIAAETDEKIAIQLPTGMVMEITNVSSFTGAVGAAGATFSVGTTSSGQEIVADVAMVAGAMQHTIVEGTVAAAGTVYVQIVGGAATGTVALPIAVTITGYVLVQPTVLNPRTVSGT